MALVRNKLRPPQLRSDAITRSALVERLGTEDRTQVVLLVGPAGHGKSTTLMQLHAAARAAGRATAWLTVDEGDNEHRQLYEHLRALFAELGDASVPPAPAAAPSAASPAWIAAHLQALARPVSLFFDDFHLLEAPELLAVFRRLLITIPEFVHVYIAARELPELGLTRLSLRGALTVLHPADLCFSRAEVAQFFAASDLRSDELDALHRRTAGWPAAVQLFRLALGSPAVRASLGDPDGPHPRALSAYLSENVLALQAPDMQEFLLHTAPLESLTPALCNHVTGRDDAHLVLARLERAGFFIRSLESDAVAFRYHPLFAQLLTAQLAARSEAQLRDVHRRAMAFYLARGELAGVVRHAIACADYERAADALNAWASELVASGRLATVERWLERIPRAALAARIDLCIKATYALIFLRRHPKLAALRSILESATPGTVAATTDPRIALLLADVCARDVFPEQLTMPSEPVTPPSAVEGFPAFELAAQHNLLAFRALGLGQLDDAREHIALARAHGEHAAAPFSGVYTDTVSSVAHLLTGDLHAALREQRSALQRERTHDDDSLSAAALVASHVWALYEADAIDEAVALFERRQHIIARATIPDLLAVGYVAAARAYVARGEPTRASALRDEARAIARANGWSRPSAVIGWDELRGALIAGDVSLAQRLADKLGPAPSALPFLRLADHLECATLGHARFLIHTGKLAQVEGTLASEAARHPERSYRRLRIAVLQAELQARKGAEGSARRTLRKALRTASEGGFVRLLLDVPPGLAELVAAVAGSTDEPAPRTQPGAEGLHDVRAQVGRPPSVPPRPDAAAARLSERELQILQELAVGTSNRAIARALFVSENTIKYHLKSLYGKLQVEGRVQAVRAAQRLGVIT